MRPPYQELKRRLETLRRECPPGNAGISSREEAARLDRVAALFYTCGQFGEVRRIGRCVSAYYREIGFDPGMVRSDVRVGHSLIHLGLATEGVSLAESLLDRMPADHPERKRAEILLAYSLMKTGRFDEAMRACSAADSAGPSERERSSCSFIRAWSSIGLGDLRRADLEAGEAVRRAERASWEYGLVGALHCRVVVQKNMGMPGPAARSLRSALRLLAGLSYPYLHAHSLLSLANLNVRLGRPARALRRLDEAGALADAFDWEILKPTLSAGRARVLRLLGRKEGALRDASQARKLAETRSHRRTLVLAHEELGELALLRGDLAKAERSFAAGLGIAEEIAPGGDIVAELARRLADVRIEQGRIEEARELAVRSLDVARGSSDRREEGACYRTLARIDRAEGLLPRAREKYNRSVAIFRLTFERIELARTLEERGRFEPVSARDLAEAEALLRRAGMIKVRTEGSERRDRSSVSFLPDAFAPIVTGCRSMEVLIEAARRVAAASCPVLLLGETGTGKELFARAIHDAGRRGRPFVALNCAAVASSLLESELFGHAAGSFTGAGRPKRGLLEEAGDGTVLLDEIDKASTEFQSKLLRFLDTGEMRRVGETRQRRVEARILSAMNRDPQELIAEGKLLPDLLYRLKGIQITIPPLRDRDGDINLLANRFLAECSARTGRVARLTPAGAESLERYHWPGNVRELKNVVERAAAFAENGLVAPETLGLGKEAPPAVERCCGASEPVSPLVRAERAIIVESLREQRGNISGTARKLGISRSSLYRKIRKFRLDAAF